MIDETTKETLTTHHYKIYNRKKDTTMFMNVVITLIFAVIGFYLAKWICESK